jgi:CRP-like cAMP-binding protein
MTEREGARTDAGLSLPVHLTRQSLADMIGTTVETTIRIVRRWPKSGLIVEDDGRFVLRDVAALRGVAEED